MVTKKEKNDLKKTLQDILQKEEHIQFAYLFGSTARMNAHQKSDVDIAVYLEKNVIQKERFYPEKLAAKIEKRITKAVDVRVLNDQNLVFLHQVLKDAELLVNNNDKERVLFETRVIDQYLDFKYYLDQYNTIRRGRLTT